MTSMKWTELSLKLSDPILEVLKSLKFLNATPVQTACIPVLLDGKDVVVEAVTGSGKTLAYIVPLLELMMNRVEKWRKFEVGAIIISPTRELAIQISKILDHFLEHFLTFRKILLIGGSTVKDDIVQFKKGSNIIIATPGRLVDIFHNAVEINLISAVKSLELLVLDEADKLLDMGFSSAINTIISFLPRLRRTGLFSATLTKEIKQFIRVGLRNPTLIIVKETKKFSTPLNLNNYYSIITYDKKLAFMINFIKVKGINLKYMIFFSTCACVDYYRTIIKFLLPSTKVLSIHGKMKNKRNKIFEEFQTLTSGLLLCTDVMARGIDIPEVNWVIQYDPPSSSSSFVHRCGRTARIGNSGNALLLLSHTEDTYIDFIKKNQKVQLQELIFSIDEVFVDECLNCMRNLQLIDRFIYDKANRAVVSFIQAYQKHECYLILRLKDLNLGQVFMGFGLLKVPKMPEVKGQDLSSFKEFDIDINSLAYKNKKKESLRRHKLEKFNSTGIWPGQVKKQIKNTESWSKTKKSKLEKKEKRKTKQEMLRKHEQDKVIKKKKRTLIKIKDLQDLKNDIALIKKFKKKKISDEQFEKSFG